MKRFLPLVAGLAFTAVVALAPVTASADGGSCAAGGPTQVSGDAATAEFNTDPVTFTGNDITMYIQGGSTPCVAVAMSMPASMMVAFGTSFLTRGQFVVGPDLTSAQLVNVPVTMTESDQYGNPVATFQLVISTTFTGTGPLTRSHVTYVSNSPGAHFSQHIEAAYRSASASLCSPSDPGCNVTDPQGDVFSLQTTGAMLQDIQTGLVQITH
jgi:hypothetical protein